MKLSNKKAKEVVQGIAEEIEKDLDRYLEWELPQVALDSNEKLYNQLAMEVLNLVSKRYFTVDGVYTKI
jgi:hypothetical protein